MSIDIQDSDSDSKSLKRKKTSVLKKYSSTSLKSIESANELSVVLFSLGRNEESLKILKSYSEQSQLEIPRYERWEAVCYAMLLQAHIENILGNERESRRLLERVDNEYFNPNSWFTENDFDEFVNSINTCVDSIEGATKSEKLQVRSEGILALLYAYYFWSKKWGNFKKRLTELEQAIEVEAKKVTSYVS